MRRPTRGPSPREACTPPEEEPRRGPTTWERRRLRTAEELQGAVCLRTRARPSSFPSSAFSKGAESVSLLPFGRFNRRCPDRGEALGRGSGQVSGVEHCRLQHSCSMDCLQRRNVRRPRFPARLQGAGDVQLRMVTLAQCSTGDWWLLKGQ